MQVKDAKPGTIVETLIFGQPSGNIYKLGESNGYGKYAFCRFTGHRVALRPDTHCQDVSKDYQEDKF